MSGTRDGSDLGTMNTVRQGWVQEEGSNRVTRECRPHLPGRDPFPQKTEACHISPS